MLLWDLRKKIKHFFIYFANILKLCINPNRQGCLKSNRFSLMLFFTCSITIEYLRAWMREDCWSSIETATNLCLLIRSGVSLRVSWWILWSSWGFVSITSMKKKYWNGINIRLVACSCTAKIFWLPQRRMKNSGLFQRCKRELSILLPHIKNISIMYWRVTSIVWMRIRRYTRLRIIS